MSSVAGAVESSVTAKLGEGLLVCPPLVCCELNRTLPCPRADMSLTVTLVVELTAVAVPTTLPPAKMSTVAPGVVPETVKIKELAEVMSSDESEPVSLPLSRSIPVGVDCVTCTETT